MTTPATERLFSYGSLRMEAVQIAIFGRRLAGTEDVMPGFRQTFIEITDPTTIALSGTRRHSIVSPSDHPDDEVAGTVFEVTPAELLAADTYEPQGYKRANVRLQSGVEAWVYVIA